MAGRLSRFIDGAVDLLVVPTTLNIKEKIAENSSMIAEFLDEEKSASSSFGDAWSQATDAYNSHFKEKLSAKDSKKINEELAQNLPDSLKQNPTFLAIAVIVCTQDPSDFFDEYNNALRTMFAGNDWDSFSFKSLFLLLDLAVKLLPSRPDPQLNKNVFRGLDTERDFTKDEELCLGYTASFTVRRYLALGNKPTKDEDGGDDDDANNETEDSSGVKLTKTLLKVAFNSNLKGLGVRHLSEKGDSEREVLVLPHQRFRVVNVKKKPKKGFTIVEVKPISA